MNIWSKNNLERLVMHNPYASINEIIEKMNDKAIQDAYLPIAKSAARAVSMPVTSRDRRDRSATSRAEKTGTRGTNKPVFKVDRKIILSERQREHEAVREKMKQIREAGVKTLSQVSEEYKAKGLVPVRFIDEYGKPCLKYVRQ